MTRLTTPTREQVKDPERLHRLLRDLVIQFNDLSSSSGAVRSAVAEMVGDGKDKKNEHVLTGVKTGLAALVQLGVDRIATKLSNLTALADPTTTDDNSKGYGIGSIWVNVSLSPQRVFILADPTTSAAFWVRMCCVGSGGGDVSGPGLSTDKAIARFNGTTGKIIQNSLITISDIGEFGGDITFLGHLIYNKSTRSVPVTLTDAATIATDASLSNRFRVTLAGNRTLGNPTNPGDGQQVVWELIQDGTGTRTITLDTKFALGTDISTVTLSTAANKRDFMTATYNVNTDKWYVIGFVKGY